MKLCYDCITYQLGYCKGKIVADSCKNFADIYKFIEMKKKVVI